LTLFQQQQQQQQQQQTNKYNIRSTAAIAKPLITKNNAKKPKRWGDDHKTWTSDDWKHIKWSAE
jgi:hypothetical protein